VRSYYIAPANLGDSAGGTLLVQQKKSLAKTSFNKMTRTEITFQLGEGMASLFSFA
jgi:hypothetical protein